MIDPFAIWWVTKYARPPFNTEKEIYILCKEAFEDGAKLNKKKGFKLDITKAPIWTWPRIFITVMMALLILSLFVAIILFAYITND